MKYDICTMMSQGNWVSFWPLPGHLCKSSQVKSSSDKLLTSSWAFLQVRPFRPSPEKVNFSPPPKHLCKSSSAIANLVPNTPSDDTLVQRSAAHSLKLFCIFFLLVTISLRLSTRCEISDQGGATGESKGGVLLRTQPAEQGVFHLRGWGVISTFVDSFTKKLLIFHLNESWSLIF